MTVAEVVTLPRRAIVGGSTIAAANGIDPYCTPRMAWLHATGRVPVAETDAMRWGRLLEPLIVAELLERGWEDGSQEIPGEVADPARPWLVGHPDGAVWDDPDAPLALLEVKTMGYGRALDTVPLQYQAQAQTYLHLTGLERAIVAILLHGQHLETFTLERDDAAIAALLEGAEAFADCVTRDVPPAVTADDADALRAMFPRPEPGRVVRATRTQRELVRELRARRERIAFEQARAAEIECQIKDVLGDAEALLGLEDVPLVTWRAVASRRIDTARLKTEAPAVYQRFLGETTTRRFEVK